MDFWLKNLLLFYKNYGILALFYKELADINADSSFNIILGDFNISVIEQKSQIWELLSNYMQIFFEATQISESLQDHVYIQKAF